MIEMRDVSFSYGKTPVLKHIDLQFESGKLYAVVGPNGCGKTTMIKHLAGLLKPAEGEIRLEQREYREYGRKEFARRVALLPQGRNVPDISVYDLVCCGRYPYLDVSKRMKPEDEQAVYAALQTTDTLCMKDKNIKKLSGGERQRAYIAMLYAQDTPCVLLDEPTTHLDMSYGFQIMEMLKQMREAGKCVIAVLHDLPFALKYADEIVLMQDGKVVSVANPEAIVESGTLNEVMQIRCQTVNIHGEMQYIVGSI